MTFFVNNQSNDNGISNRAVGTIITDAVAAAAASLTLGFTPRVFRLHNLTDRISDEWYEGMDESTLFTNIRALAAKLDADGTVTDTNYAALWNPTVATLTALQTAVRGITAKLDADATVTGTDYSALWNPQATVASLRAIMAGITAKLDADTGVADTDYASTLGHNVPSLHTAANGDRTLGLTNGIQVNDDRTVTLTATTLVASKVFAWEAEG